MSMYTNLGNALHIQVENEQIEIRAWAPNSFRVRARMSGDILDQDWALLPTPPETPASSFAAGFCAPDAPFSLFSALALPVCGP